MNLTIKELAELAHKTEPDKKWLTSNDSVFYEAPGTYDYDNVYFSPSLTGEDWQKAQALDCIVAAFKVKPSKQFNTELVYSPAGFSFLFCERMEGSVSKVGPEPDILQAAISALLGKEA